MTFLDMIHTMDLYPRTKVHDAIISHVMLEKLKLNKFVHNYNSLNKRKAAETNNRRRRRFYPHYSYSPLNFMCENFASRLF